MFVVNYDDTIVMVTLLMMMLNLMLLASVHIGHCLFIRRFQLHFCHLILLILIVIRDYFVVAIII